MNVQGISNSLSGGAGPYNPFPSSPGPDGADIMGMSIGAVVRNPMDKVVLSTTFKDASDQAARDAQSAPKDQRAGNPVTSLLPGVVQDPADPLAGSLTNAQYAELIKASPAAAEQVQKQEQNAAGGSASIADLQSVALLTMNPDTILAAIRQSQYNQATPAKGTKVDAIA